MKRAKVNGETVLGADTPKRILYERASEGVVSDSQTHEDFSSRRMLENLKLALFFCQAQGRMARGEK